MPSSSLTAFCDATLFTGEAMVEGHALLVAHGKITDIVRHNRIPPEARRISHAGQILAPGFIDAQVNGGGNVLFNSNPTPEACIAIAEAHRKHGTARILVTCVTDTPDITARAITAMRAARRLCPNILGIHIEGPHLGIQRRGVHKADYIRPMAEADLDLYKCESGEVMLMTVAPENVTPEEIRRLRQQGVIISIGHTAASATDIRAALSAGATGFTHLFNGMGDLTARDDGPVSTALDDRNSWCSVIADGHHVSPEMLRLAVRSKPVGKVILVSDAMAPAATEDPQPFQLYSETIHVIRMPGQNTKCVTNEGKLAGSAITLTDAVKHCVKIGITLEEALRMASTYPAAFLGLSDRYGKLLPGYGENLVAFTP